MKPEDPDRAAVRRGIADGVRRAVTLDALPWYELQILAYHEAAHAVAQREMGRVVHLVTLEDAADERRAYTYGETEALQMASVDTVAGRAAVERDCVYLLAGWAAEHVIGHSAPTQLTTYARYDFYQASRVIQLLDLTEAGREASLRFVQEKTLSLVRDARVLRHIRRLADALLKQRTLMSGEVERLLRASDREENGEVRARRWMRRRIVSIRSPTLVPLTAAPMQANALPEHKWPLRVAPTDRFAAQYRYAAPLLGLPDLCLSNMALGGLRRGGIKTLGELLNCTERDLLGIRAVGAKTVAEIVTALHRVGLALAATSLQTLPLRIKRRAAQPWDFDRERAADILRLSPRIAKRLQEHGIVTIADLRRCSRSRLVERTGIPLHKAEEIVGRAEEAGIYLPD